jgi:hypothetical protein
MTAPGSFDDEFLATVATIEALRALRAPWRSVVETGAEVVVTTDQGVTVRLSEERAELPPGLVAFRLRAQIEPGAPDTGASEARVEGFDQRRNDVVIFHGETWLARGDARVAALADAPLDAERAIQFAGALGARTDDALFACQVTDAVLFAGSSGDGMLVQCGWPRPAVTVTRDPQAIARFLGQRGYRDE